MLEQVRRRRVRESVHTCIGPRAGAQALQLTSGFPDRSHDYPGRRTGRYEHETVNRDLSRVRNASDWVESAVTTGSSSLDEGPAALLRGE
ncbi:DUF6192 family protein [Kitasatospora sp. NPDC101155]|uniref:DUF6192 family protein n=1 Tax=Kitasatospora sp. NPDC101155 TaxID=3364097 RepID=UPI0037F4A304